MSKQLYKIAAQKLLQLDSQCKEYEKRAHALQLIYKQAELGYGELPRSYGEMQEKIASLCKQDLNVMEKALELTGGNLKFGELTGDDPHQLDATKQFQASILGEP